jgi:hypothetical protein
MMQCVQYNRSLPSRLQQRVKSTDPFLDLVSLFHNISKIVTSACCADLSKWFALPACDSRTNSHHKQNALFNSALRQSTSIRKDLDQFADTAAPSPHLQAQLNASLTSFARTIDDYGKLAKQEPVQTKQEKAFERLKNFRSELEEYRNSFKRIKSANEDVVRLHLPCLLQHMSERSTNNLIANNGSAHRTARSPSTQHGHSRKSLLAA